MLGRMCAITTEEPVQDVTMNTSALLINSTPTIILFESSSTHTFIVKTFVDRLSMSMEDLGYDLVV